MKKMPAEKVTKNENRRSNKPLMEKRRRARINQSLSELKNLILDAIKKDSSRNSKLEKADILEMAVKHLRNLQRQQQAIVASTSETTPGNKYRAGFNECATEVTRFLDKMEGLDASVRGRLISHLFNCLNELCSPSESSNGISTTTSHDPPSGNGDTKSETGSDVLADGAVDDGRATPSTTGLPAQTPPLQPIQVHIPTSSIPVTLVPQIQATSGITDPASPERTTTIVHGLQLIPTRLSNGEIAFVLDNQSVRTSAALATVSPSLTLATSVTAPATAPRSSQVTSTSQERASPDGSVDSRSGHSKAPQEALRGLSGHPHGHKKPARVLPANGHRPLVGIKEENVWRPW